MLKKLSSWLARRRARAMLRECARTGHSWIVTHEDGFCGRCGLHCSQDEAGWMLYRLAKLEYWEPEHSSDVDEWGS